ncbi:MAG: FkbM family methyltransferase [Thermoleophilia bacterium]|nr:FkbM family methyltransferase [Thermoleophilia bacterium]
MTGAQGDQAHQPELHGTGRLSGWVRSTIDRIAPLRSVVKSPLVQNLIYTARVSRQVERPLAFVAGELRGEGTEAVVLRRSGLTANLRRGSGDLVMLHQIIGRDVYRPPVEVSERLGRVEGPLRIADLGANVGFFTLRQLESYPGCEIVAVEADPGNAALLARTLAANRLEPRVELVEAAASNAPGSVEFAAGNFFESHVVEGDGGDGTIEVRMIDALPLLAGRHLVKIDIEGSEWPILADPRFRELEAVALTLEWHIQGCPGSEPRQAAEDALAAAGYTVRHDHSEPGCGTLWAWR